MSSIASRRQRKSRSHGRRLGNRRAIRTKNHRHLQLERLEDRVVLTAGVVTTTIGSSDFGQDHFIELNAELALIWPVITEAKPPPDDAAEWDGKPDKLELLER